MFKQNKGFTLVELIMVISVFVILAAGSFLAFNPAKRLGEANNTQRWEDVTAIAKAVELYQIDNDALPDDLANANVNTGQKKVLCSSASSLICDGQDRDCLVVNDDDFIKSYFGDFLPVDPQKTTQTDTGYYITRSGDNMMTFGACESYGSDAITYVAKASLATYTTTCGDGETEGDEVCDDNNTITETQICGNNIREYGTHCNADCSASITLIEVCDDNNTYTEECGNGIQEIGTFCNENCTVELVLNEVCDSSLSGECSIPSGYYTADYTHAASTCLSSKIAGVACNATCTVCSAQCMGN